MDGLTTGAAAPDSPEIPIGRLYHYAHDKVLEHQSSQTPQLWLDGPQTGQFVIGRNPNPPASETPARETSSPTPPAATPSAPKLSPQRPSTTEPVPERDGGGLKSLLRSKLVLSLLSILVLAAVFFGVYQAFQAPPVDRQRIAALLTEAEQALAEGPLSMSTARRARSAYRQALALDPDGTGVRRGLDKIVDWYLDRATRRIDEGRFDDARAYLDAAAHAGVRSDEIETARRRVGQAERAQTEPGEEPPDYEPSAEPGSILRDRISDGSEGPEMVVIPAGCFQMGSPKKEPERDDDERQHEVLGNVWEWTCSGYGGDYGSGEQRCAGKDDEGARRLG